MQYLNIFSPHELNHILCGRLEAKSFVHMYRLINIHVLIVVEEGVLNIEIGGVRHKIRRGEAVLLPAFVPHTGFCDNDTDGRVSYFWAHFTAEKSELSDERSGDLSLPCLFKLADYARVRILYNQLLDVNKLSGTKKKYCDFLFTALCCEIASQAEYENISGNKTVNHAIAWIEMNINSPVSLEQVAAALGYNKRYLSRIFQKNTGMTINEFITDRKMNLAKQLLTGSDEKISSIAMQLGFGDAGYFMRTFKKHEGVTCREYRNAYSKMYKNKI